VSDGPAPPLPGAARHRPHSQRFAAIPEALLERRKSSGRLGPLLAWAVVFADIGTSIYYVPGLLFRELGGQSPSPAAAFVAATGIAFVFLSLKYVDVAARYPDGGGASVAGAARKLGATAVMVGTSQRNAIWHLLRGNVLRSLVKELPADTRVWICN